MLVDLVLRWMHIFSAIILVGGTFFLRFSFAPTLAAQSDDTRQSLLDHWRPRWARLVMMTSGLLLVSGLVNAVNIIKQYDFTAPAYHGLVAVKLLLAFAVFWLSASIAGRSERAQRFRADMIKWLNITVLLATITVALGGYMKLCERTPKVDEDADLAPPSVVIEG